VCVKDDGNEEDGFFDEGGESDSADSEDFENDSNSDSDADNEADVLAAIARIKSSLKKDVKSKQQRSHD
jgi:hypothetical protein